MCFTVKQKCGNFVTLCLLIPRIKDIFSENMGFISGDFRLTYGSLPVHVHLAFGSLLVHSQFTSGSLPVHFQITSGSLSVQSSLLINFIFTHGSLLVHFQPDSNFMFHCVLLHVFDIVCKCYQHVSKS